MNELYKQLEPLGHLEYDVPFKNMTTLRVGGNADVVLFPKDMIALEQALILIKEQKVPYLIVGKGSNLLCSDERFCGVVIRLDRDFIDHYFLEDVCIAEAGCSIIGLAYGAAKEGLSGLEFASGIPGTVGGAVFMNAGAYHSCMYDVLLEVLVYKDEQFVWMDKDELEMSYRHSIFKDNRDWIILGAKFQLEKGDVGEIRDVMEQRRLRRIESQPLDLPSAGSVFRNHQDLRAWHLIEKVGHRGFQVGDARMSDKHCNFAVNLGNASANDIWSVISKTKEKVLTEEGIELILEIERFNWNE